MARLQQFYKDAVVGELSKRFGYKSIMDCLLYTSPSPRD